jgi:uncharacterized protein (TIGR00251 family)
MPRPRSALVSCGEIPEPPSPVRETPDGVTVIVHVQPGASRTEPAGLHGDALKFRVAAPPVEGAANEALRRAFAQTVNLPLRDVRIEHGMTGRRKTVSIAGVSAAAVRAALGLGAPRAGRQK